MRLSHRTDGLLWLAFWLAVCLPVLAQSGAGGWSEPVVLTPDAAVVAFSPVAVADSAGHLHVVWTQGEGAGEGSSFDSIYYVSFDGRTWSTPIDIAVSAQGVAMSFLKGFMVTDTGLLAVTWSEGQDIRMAVAVASGATSAQAWRTSWVANGVNPSLAATPEGDRWYLAYWSDTSTLVVSVSQDEGLTWGAPQLVWSAEDGAAGSNVTALVAHDDVLHLVWTEAAEARAWNGVAIWHARIDPSTPEASVREVSRSASLDEPTLDGANIAGCPNGELHIIWNNGVGSSTGRFHQWFDIERGRWTQVSPIFPGLSGQTSKPGLVCDNTGRVHLLTSAQGGEAGGGLHYAAWLDGTWTDYTTLWRGDYNGERPSMVIVGGNELHLLWQVFDLDGQRVDSIAHTYRAIEAEPEGPVATDRPVAAATPAAVPTATSVTISTALPLGDSPMSQPVPADTRSGAVSPLVISIAAVLPLLGTAIWLSGRGRRRS